MEDFSKNPARGWGRGCGTDLECICLDSEGLECICLFLKGLELVTESGWAESPCRRELNKCGRKKAVKNIFTVDCSHVALQRAWGAGSASLRCFIILWGDITQCGFSEGSQEIRRVEGWAAPGGPSLCDGALPRGRMPSLGGRCSPSGCVVSLPEAGCGVRLHGAVLPLVSRARFGEQM